MQDLKISLIQSELYWQSIDANLAMFEEKIWNINEQTDVIVLPEMFSTGFTMETTGLSEPPNSKTYRWMAQMAGQTGALVIGSYIVKEGNKCFNRLLAVMPDGKYMSYDKRHLFRMANEHHHFSSGPKRTILSWKGWKILPQVCYDLRFPVWSRNTSIEGKPEYDLLIYVANWPEARISAWDTLLKARAIENLSYTVGLNRTGIDGNKIQYNGHSGVSDPKGESILFMKVIEGIQTISLPRKSLDEYREKFPAYLDSDHFEIK